MIEAARRWVASFPSRKSLGEAVRANEFRPFPFDGPQAGPACWVVAISADRTGVYLLDSGGGIHRVAWEEL